MKYAGNITILDDEGNTVYDQDLSQDEIIETLLAALPDAEDEAKKAEETEPVQAAASTSARSDSDTRPCCGSLKRGRHRKGCVEAGRNLKYPKAAEKSRRRTVDNRHPFSEPTFNIVKDMLEDESVDGIVAEKGLDPDEVRRCDLADDYADYLAIA